MRSLVRGLESPDSALGLPVVARLPVRKVAATGDRARGCLHVGATPQAVSLAAAATTQMERLAQQPGRPQAVRPEHHFLLCLGHGAECGQFSSQPRPPWLPPLSLALLALESLTSPGKPGRGP